jgi:hypothetical protein
MNKNNFWIKLFFIVALFIAAGLLFSFSAKAQSNYFQYTPMEKLPGSEGVADFPGFVAGIYKFGIWTVGIAALLMLTIGGFMYMTSAGNMSKNSVAKDIIRDALIGLVIAFSAYLILYVINPDLIKINVSLKPLGTGTSQTPGAGTTGGKSGTGTCTPLTTGSCAPENLKACSWDADKASAICNAESGGKEGLASGVDICTDGKPFSIGLFQINLTCQCKDAFSPQKDKGCVNRACSVSNSSRYNSCVSTFSQASSNVNKACEIYKAQGWNGWGANSKCGF